MIDILHAKYVILCILQCSIFPEETKEEAMKCASSNATFEFQILVTEPFLKECSIKGKAKQLNLGLSRFQFPILENRK